MSLADELQPYRDSDSPMTIAPLMNNAAALSVIGAWSNFPGRKLRALAKKRPDDSHERWLWLWDACEVDIEQLALMTNLSVRDAEDALHACVLNRAIYPDGSVGRFAGAMVVQHVKNLLPRKG